MNRHKNQRIMKKAFNLNLAILLLSLSFTFGYANNNLPFETDRISMITSTEVSFDINVEFENYFADINYNESNNYLSLKTIKVVELIQIFNDNGSLEFQLPVQGKQIHISLDDFIQGKYEVNLKFEHENTFVSTEMTKK